MVGRLVQSLGNDRRVQVAYVLIALAIGAVVLLMTGSLGWSGISMALLGMFSGLCRMKYEGRLR